MMRSILFKGPDDESLFVLQSTIVIFLLYSPSLFLLLYKTAFMRPPERTILSPDLSSWDIILWAVVVVALAGVLVSVILISLVTCPVKVFLADARLVSFSFLVVVDTDSRLVFSKMAELREPPN